ncbi:MAG: VOC family protein [Thermoanaerobaculia bacterium]
MARVPGLTGSGALLTIGDAVLTVRPNRHVWELKPRHIDSPGPCRQSQGRTVRWRTVQEVQLAIGTKRDAIDVGFGRAVLGYVPMANDDAVDLLGYGSTIWMQALDDSRPLRHARRRVGRASTALRASKRRSPQAAASSTRPMRLRWTLAARAGIRVFCAWPDGSAQ